MLGAVILMVGIPGSGKSTLAGRWFRKTQITNLDGIRGWVADDENDQTATGTAVRLQTMLVHARCERRLVTCVDNTNLVPEHRAPLLGFAAEFGLPTYAVVFDVAEDEAIARNRLRAEAGGRDVPDDVIRAMYRRMVQHTPADGPLDGFTATIRIGSGGRRTFGTPHPDHAWQPWGV